MDYAVAIYRFSTELPEHERYNLASQLRKAATSVPLNIAEGSGCATSNEFSRFLSYAYRSLKEIMTGVELCRRLYPALSSDTISGLIEEGDQIARMIHGLIQRLGQAHDGRTRQGHAARTETDN